MADLARIGRPVGLKDQWVIHAFKAGEVREVLPLHPKHFRETYDSELELIQAVADRIGTDEQFARRWFGWLLIPVHLSASVLVAKLPEVKAS